MKIKYLQMIQFLLLAYKVVENHNMCINSEEFAYAHVWGKN